VSSRGVGAFGVAGASDETAVLAPLDHQGLPHFSHVKSVASHPLDVGHVLFGVLQVFVEALVELRHGGAPVELAFLDSSSSSSMRAVYVTSKMSSKLSSSRSVTTMPSRWARSVRPPSPRIRAPGWWRGWKRRWRAGPRRRPPAVSPAWLRCSAGRLGEVLLGLDSAEAQALSLGHRRQPVPQLLVFLVGLVLAFLVGLQKPRT